MMSAYQNNYYLGDAYTTINEKIDGFSNIFDVDRIEPGMSANIYVAFDTMGDTKDLFMIYDDGHIVSDYKGYVYVKEK